MNEENNEDIQTIELFTPGGFVIAHQVGEGRYDFKGEFGFASREQFEEFQTKILDQLIFNTRRQADHEQWNICTVEALEIVEAIENAQTKFNFISIHTKQGQEMQFRLAVLNAKKLDLQTTWQNI